MEISGIKKMEKLDTCDLIFFSGNNLVENFIKLCTFSKFTHVGMIIKENDILYVWESDMGERHKKGARVIRLDDKIKYWHGNKDVAIKKYVYQFRPTSDQILRIVDKYINLHFNDGLYQWFLGGIIEERSLESAFCSQLIAKTLQDLGLLSKRYPSSSYSPSDFLNIKVQRGYYDEAEYFKIF